ncbi:N-(5'-phosphoribosyl)anthranilate isomerase [Pseudorhodobacter sp. MZDSW-24AT]|uniref:N-(5'-phosphoribosyl)anthranilate isomerase n=1 Tax=Pseudorhodobacter sp. MZDSW-24AT TaxID=2052957 RepID=UPI000C1F4E5C|nr:N-(5'-phosphoribosyl)anthranilate isomerase [Pseudorhodobacter sp. MZDSW-24AT]PJF10761.1 N-(5'-phosphoribosyl)anthranilate isomerase [Pseudorhodobacter sp. MZDSW-24AT]
MEHVIRQSNADYWINQVFAARQARGGVLRRAVVWVEREIGQERFVQEVRMRGFHLLRAGDQFIVICASRPVQILF